MPGKRRRHHHTKRGLQARRPHRVGPFAHMHRHGTHRVLAQRADIGNDHDAHHQTGGEHVEAGQVGVDPLQQRRDEQQREIAVDDRRDTAEHFEQRLGNFADAERRELGEVDGEHRADRNGHQQRDERRRQRAREQRHDAEVRVVKQRRPLRVGQKIDQRHLRKKAIDSQTSIATMASVVNTETSAASSSTPRCRLTRRRRRRFIDGVSGLSAAGKTNCCGEGFRGILLIVRASDDRVLEWSGTGRAPSDAGPVPVAGRCLRAAPRASSTARWSGRLRSRRQRRYRASSSQGARGCPRRPWPAAGCT